MIALIQARMTSTRLPGKSLMNCGNRPLLQWVLESVDSLKFVDEAIVLTSTNATDDRIDLFCTSQGVRVFRGDIDNVLLRFKDAVDHFGISEFVRITADNPFYMNDVSNQAYKIFRDSNADYLHIEGLSHIVPEFLNKTAIDYALTNATEQHHFEHVTTILREKNAKVSLKVVEVLNHELGLSKKLDRYLTVDTKTDFDRFELMAAKGIPNSKQELYETIEKQIL